MVNEQETEELYDNTDEEMNEGVTIDNVSENETETTEQGAPEDILAVEIEALQKKLEETEQRLLRVQADYDNYRRRTKNEAIAQEKYRAQSLVTDLLPVLDNFERALAVDSTSEEVANVLKGVDMVYQQMKQSLEKEGVTEIESVGQQFDPNVHQAVMQVSEEGIASGEVVEELQKGYTLKDRVLRPSMVKVNE
ncbi:nucleotide exchange factor GrpE [Bacillaceae bacterium SIJ1]|uniref:nucleotide exchange factor GrpE n=1 Tax=Litoribacterium kuwaitense TaxID=1398745 RepID=UPI0013ED389A|nr:nucleotide exchange factor GrpE [Litoribacterium kuwaitense]